MKSTVTSVLKTVLPLLFGAFLVWYSLQKISIETLTQYFKNANYNWIFLGVFLGVLSHLSRAYRWNYMTSPMGYNLKLPNSIMAVFSAYLINYTIPRAGEVTRATIVANYEGIPFEKGFGTILSERIADVLMMLFIMALALFLEYDLIFDFFLNNFNPKQQFLWGLSVLAVAAVLYTAISRSQWSTVVKIRRFFLGVFEGATSIFKMKYKWSFIAHTIFIWAMYILMFYVTALSIEQTSELPFSAILIGFIAASFSIGATNGGIGSYPIAVYAALAIFNVPEAPSLAFGWIMWTSHTLMIIILGGISLVLLPIYNSFSSQNTSKN